VTSPTPQELLDRLKSRLAVFRVASQHAKDDAPKPVSGVQIVRRGAPETVTDRIDRADEASEFARGLDARDADALEIALKIGLRLDPPLA